MEKTYGYEPNYGLDTFDPNIYQGYSNTCAIRSQEIVLRDYGIMLSQDQLINYATENGWFNPDPTMGGTDKSAVGNILDACGVETTRTENATISDIISELRAGHRVIVSVDADELWNNNESNLLKKTLGEIKNKANDNVQNFLGIEGANHALVVGGVNVNPNDSSDIKVCLIDSGTGDVCKEYDFKDFQDAWKDGHCLMVSTKEPAPYQYNYTMHQMEPSSFNTEFIPSMTEMPKELSNQFVLTDNYYTDYNNFEPIYDNDDNPINPNYDSDYTDEDNDNEKRSEFFNDIEEEENARCSIDNDCDDENSDATLNDDDENISSTSDDDENQNDEDNQEL